MTKATVHYRWVRTGPRKIRPVLDLIRGQKVSYAIGLTQNLNRPTTEPLTKLLKSSISAARDQNPALDGDQLKVIEVYCNEGPRMYRLRYKGRGRGSNFAKRSCHITLTVEEIGKMPYNKTQVKAEKIKESSDKKVAKTSRASVKKPKLKTSKERPKASAHDGHNH